jgi:2-C-methyl-D-erythritol 4-phosphate cytidylyltransferase
MRAAVIVAGGGGERFGREGGKQLAPVAGLPLVGHTLRAFDRCESVDAIVLVCHPDRIDEYRRAAVDGAGVIKVVATVAGGATRRLSVAAGLAALPAGCSLIAVHDGARAFVDPATITGAFDALDGDPALDGVVVGHPAYDTIKEADASGRVMGTPDRSHLWIAQTPQVFRADALMRAHARAEAEGFEGTDDASLVERDGGTVRMIEGPYWNLKVTVPEDLDVLCVLLARRGEEERA